MRYVFLIELLCLAFVYQSGCGASPSISFEAESQESSTVQAPTRKSHTVYAVSRNIGRFYREGLLLHPQAKQWKYLALPASGDREPSPIVQQVSGDLSTVHFDTLASLLRGLADVRAKFGPIDYLTIAEHGIPGGLWSPRDDAEISSPGCASWRRLRDLPDDAAFTSYYRVPTKEQLAGDDLAAQAETPGIPCHSTSEDWSALLDASSDAQDIFNDGALFVFAACRVGSGAHGEAFLRTLASAFNVPGLVLAASPMYIALDWSMQGLGFWEYQNDDQLTRDTMTYAVAREDRRIAMALGQMLVLDAGKARMEAISGVFPLLDGKKKAEAALGAEE